ncbi:1-acyl-sn-glycerol-3-phosphate acyltransferase [Halomonadaceae bacterium KBTZ08]
MTHSDDIRPFSDDEVQPVIDRLLSRPEFQDLIGRFRMEWLHRVLPGAVRLWVRWQLGRRLRDIHSVETLQHRLVPMIERGLRKTTDAITWSGLDQLDSERPCLFLSSHRDIVLDPALVNFVLYKSGYSTTRIAIGDNLVEKPMVADMMRLNKSFIVRRNLSNPREMRNAFLTLSHYIRESLDDGHSIWMAQREGRAKDSIDLTDPAIIKMLHMSHKRDGTSISEAIKALNIVPVAISYEYDPCDRDKARELESHYRLGSYSKRPGEDMESIVRGITGHKGRVHVAFGTPLSETFENAQAAANGVDDQILSLLRFFPVNHAAAEKLATRNQAGPLPERADQPSRAQLKQAHEWLDNRLRDIPPEQHPWFLGVYANALLRSAGIEVAQLRDPLAEEAPL